MEMIRRKIKLFFVSYGKLLALVIGSIAAIIFFIQSLNSMVIKQNNEKYASPEYQNNIKQNQEKNKDIKYISEFIDLCNEGKIEEAYEMLSNKCKEEKYSTIEIFEEEYIKKVFYINICKYKTLKKDNTYITTLTQDMLVTGRQDSVVETKVKVESVLERKIYIYY